MPYVSGRFPFRSPQKQRSNVGSSPQLAAGTARIPLEARQAPHRRLRSRLQLLHGLRPFPTHTEIRGKDRPAAGSLFNVAVRAFPCPLKAAASARHAVKVVLLLPMRLIRPEQQAVIKVARLLPGFCGFPRTDRTMNRPPCPEP